MGVFLAAIPWALTAAGIGLPVWDFIRNRMDNKGLPDAAGRAGLESVLTQTPLDLVQPLSGVGAMDFVAGVLTRGDAATQQAAQTAFQGQTLMDVLGPRARDLAAISVQTQPHPLELIAAARGYAR